MKKILIFGGTQFVGKRLVSNLLEKDYDITIASRGNWKIPHFPTVKHVVIDRFDPDSFKILRNKNWDVIIDQIAFCGHDAKLIVDNFKGLVGKVVAISSSAVYESSLDCSEDEFNPLEENSHSIDLSKHLNTIPDTEAYKLGKREVEIVYSKSEISSALIRFPKIIGLDDLSFRFYSLYKKIKNNEIINISKKSKKISLINSREAARFLSFMVSNSIDGPINASLDGIFTIDYFENKFNREVNFSISENEESLFLGNEIVLNHKKANNSNFHFEKLNNFLDELTLLYDFYEQKLR